LHLGGDAHIQFGRSEHKLERWVRWIGHQAHQIDGRIAIRLNARLVARVGRVSDEGRNHRYRDNAVLVTYLWMHSHKFSRAAGYWLMLTVKVMLM
jgi:hypothetical protein